MTVMETKTALAKKLAHDVGKYVSRAARNMNDAASRAVLYDMFLDDLYLTNGAVRASLLFAGIADRLEGMIGRHVGLDRCRVLLLRIDALEPSVRANEAAAVHEAAEATLAIDDTLRELLAELQTKDER